MMSANQQEKRPADICYAEMRGAGAILDRLIEELKCYGDKEPEELERIFADFLLWHASYQHAASVSKYFGGASDSARTLPGLRSSE
jgi:hypothetical protein